MRLSDRHYESQVLTTNICLETKKQNKTQKHPAWNMYIKKEGNGREDR
jgi:hypothetical protein